MTLCGCTTASPSLRGPRGSADGRELEAEAESSEAEGTRLRLKGASHLVMITISHYIQLKFMKSKLVTKIESKKNEGHPCKPRLKRASAVCQGPTAEQLV